MRKLTQIMTQCNIDILAVQETRWTESRTLNARKQEILSSGSKDKHELGVAFIVNDRLKESILDFNPVNKRMCPENIKHDSKT